MMKEDSFLKPMGIQHVFQEKYVWAAVVIIIAAGCILSGLFLCGVRVLRNRNRRIPYMLKAGHKSLCVATLIRRW